MRPILSLILMLVMAAPSYAFEKKKHESFSNHAVSLYEACTGRAIPKEMASALAKGAVGEDAWGLTRAMNWHFYNSGKKIGTYWWKHILLCNGSNELIYQKRVNALEGMLGSKAPNPDIYEAAGRVAHHIQDMSSPPHVMPIYHTTRDKIDSYPTDAVSVADVAAVCKEVNGTVAGPFELLEGAAQKTLKEVAKPVAIASGKGVENETWMKFWGGPDDKELSGFKTYGEYGNLFGTVPPCDSGACRGYDRSTFDKFYADCYLRAVTDTIRLIKYLDRRNMGSM